MCNRQYHLHIYRKTDRGRDRDRRSVNLAVRRYGIGTVEEYIVMNQSVDIE